MPSASAAVPSPRFTSLRHPDVTSVWDWGVGGACFRARALVAGAGGATRPRPYPACMRWPGNYIKKSKKKATSPRLLHYTRLNHTTLDYTRLTYTALDHTTLHYTARHCPTLRYPTLHCTALRYTQLDYATHHVISAEPHMLCACVHVLARVCVKMRV